MLTKSCATEFTERPGWRVYDRGAKSAQEPEHFAKGLQFQEWTETTTTGQSNIRVRHQCLRCAQGQAFWSCHGSNAVQESLWSWNHAIG